MNQARSGTPSAQKHGTRACDLDSAAFAALWAQRYLRLSMLLPWSAGVSALTSHPWWEQPRHARPVGTL